MPKLSYKQLSNLFEQAKKGDNTAFERFYYATYPAQYYYAYSILNDKFLAEDAIQNMYVSLYQNMDQVKDSLAIVQYMNKSTYFTCMTMLKKENSSSKDNIDDYTYKLADPKPSPQDLVNKKSDIDIVKLSLSQLEPSLRSVISKRYIDDMPIEDIAKDMGISKRTVIRYTKKGVVEMRKIIEKLRNSTMSLFIFAEPFVSKFIKGSITPDQATVQDSYNRFAKAANVTIASSAAVGGGIAIGTASQTPLLVKSGITILLSGSLVAGGFAISTPHYSLVTNDLKTYTSEPIEVHVNSNSIVNIREIQAYDSQGNLVDNAFQNDLTLSLVHNDTYTIKIISDSGLTSTESISVTNLDNESPSVANLNQVDEDTYIEIQDSKSGLDPTSISVIDANNQPVSFTIQDNVIHYTSPLDTTVHLSDYCNNQNTITVSHYQK